MDNHSQFYNDYYYFPTPVMSEEGNQLVPILHHNINGVPSFDVLSPESDMSAATLPELLGFPEDVDSFSEYNHLCFNGPIGGQLHQSFGDQEFSKPLGLAGQENWGFNEEIQVPAMEDQSMNMKVGRYSDEERKERIERYLKKRHQRNFNKTIKYACRKTLADRRVRVRGRFARNNNGNDQQINHEDSTHNQEIAQNKVEYNSNYHSGDVQMKYDEDDWLQEAMASLAYLPYVTAG